MNQERLRSPIVWMATLAQVLVILQATQILPSTGIELIDVVVTAIIQIAIIIGILNNPTDKTHF